MSWDPDAELDPQSPMARATASELEEFMQVMAAPVRVGMDRAERPDMTPEQWARMVLEGDVALPAELELDAKVRRVGWYVGLAFGLGGVMASVLWLRGASDGWVVPTVWMIVVLTHAAVLLRRMPRARAWVAVWQRFAVRHEARTLFRALTVLRWFREFWSSRPAASWLEFESVRAVLSFASKGGWPCLIVVGLESLGARLYLSAPPSAFGSRARLCAAREQIAALGLTMVALPGGVVVCDARGRLRGVAAETVGTVFERAVEVLDRRLSSE